MGNGSLHNSVTEQNCQALSSYTSQDIRVLQWRSNPQFNTFIPKVSFQYQQSKKSDSLISQCHQNQNSLLSVRHQKFIGNLTILNGKLTFEEALYTLKSLLSGHQYILTYFGKTIVSATCCFLTKQGEVKAWINEDYRRNTFFCESNNGDTSLGQEADLFLKPENWIDHDRPLSSQANIMQKILFLVADLTCEQKKINSFLQVLDNFITGNILKNFNFSRVKKFVNKYIYQKQLFLKSDLREVIQRLYLEHSLQKEPESDVKSIFSREPHVERKPTRMNTVREQKEQLSPEIPPIFFRNQISPERRSFAQELIQSKHSEFFNSTAYTNTNQSSKFMQSAANGYYNDAPVYRSYCMSQISGPQLQESAQIKPDFSKSHISHQYCMNFSNVTHQSLSSNKIYSQSHNKSNSLNPSQTNSSICSKASGKNLKNIQFKLQQSCLGVIHQRKQTETQEKQNILQKAGQKDLRTSILNNNQSNHFSIGQSFGKRTHKVVPVAQKQKIIEDNKKSCVSIAVKAGSNPVFLQTKTVTLLKSTCESSEKQNKKSAAVSEGVNSSSQSSLADHRNQGTQNLFTMKTINRLISSNQNISQQQHSEGEFPSLQNESSYSGILASMGRSVVILDVVDGQKPQSRTSKKQPTVLRSNKDFPMPKITAIKSYDLLIKR